MKKVLILLTILMVTLTTVNGTCEMKIDDDGSINITTNGSLRKWDDLSSSYQESCLEETQKLHGYLPNRITKAVEMARKNKQELQKKQQEVWRKERELQDKLWKKLQKKIDRAASDKYPRCFTT